MRMFPERRGHPLPDRTKAWYCLLINALVCPGLGSLLARRLSGIPQLLLAFGGAGWVLVIFVRVAQQWFQLLQAPPDWKADANSALVGLMFFVAGWIWSIITGLRLLQKSPRTRTPPKLSGPAPEPEPGQDRPTPSSGDQWTGVPD